MGSLQKQNAQVLHGFMPWAHSCAPFAAADCPTGHDAPLKRAQLDQQ
jgi:hypothetical protein